MSDFIGVVTTVGQAKIAAAIGGTALNLTTIRIGDGNGAPITPIPGMTDLVRRVGAAYPIIASGRDPVNANHWRVTALIPIEDGPFDIREIGVFDGAGDMIAIARHVLVEKRSLAQGAAVELLTDIVFPVSETAQVTVQVAPTGGVSIYQLLRAGFTVVESATVTAPPGAPALGRTHVVPAGATGAWAGLVGYLTQWNGSVWVAANVPIGFVVVDNSKDRWAGARWLERTATGWEPGLTRLLQRQPGNYAVAAGTANALSVTLDPAPGATGIVAGLHLQVKVTADNTGPATLSVNGTVNPLVDFRGAALQRGALTTGQMVLVAFDGDVWRLAPQPGATAPILSVFIDNTPGTRTFTPTITGWYELELVSAAGGGGGGLSSGCGGGAGAGARARDFVYLIAGTAYTYTVGLRGTGGAPGFNGSNGGSSSFAGPAGTIVVTGGSAGVGANTGAGGGGGAGGSGAGVSALGSIDPGQSGFQGSPQIGQSGQGGSSPAGGYGAPASFALSGGATAPGGAGAGGTGSNYGSDGTNGRLILRALGS